MDNTNNSDLLEIDVDQLIDLVKTRPAIWDNTHAGYRNNDSTRRAWGDIFRSMIADYDDKSEEEKNRLGKRISSKWTYTRDCWLRGYKKNRERVRQGLLPQDFSRNSARNEKLSFLKKVYERKEMKKLSVGNPGPSQSPVDSDAETVYNFKLADNKYKRSNNKKIFKKDNFNLSAKKLNLKISGTEKKVETLWAKHLKGESQNVSQPLFINVGENSDQNIASSMTELQKLKLQVESGKENLLLLKETEQLVDNEVHSPRNEFELDISSNTESKRKFQQISNEKLLVNSQNNKMGSSTQCHHIELSQNEIVTKESHSQSPRKILNNNDSQDSLDKEHQSQEKIKKEENVIDKKSFDSDTNTGYRHYFLQTLLPRIKDLSESQMLDFEMGVLQLIKRIKFPPVVTKMEIP